MISRKNFQPEQGTGTFQMSKVPPSSFKFSPLHLFLFLCVFLPFLVNSQATTGERTILLNLKQQLGNPPLIQSWNSSSSPCDWPEIQCTAGAVTGVLLPGKSINETIPATICDLKNLTTLDLSNNNIPSVFPTTLLHNCSNLQYLDLSQNYFVGTVPDDIDRLQNLTYLNLGGNTFSGEMPPAIGRLAKLRTLRLEANEFNGTFPKEIGDLSNLEILALAYNGKSAPRVIPPEFGKLSNLRFMWIAGSNLIGAIPESFSNLTKLEQLDLSTNTLTGEIPISLFSLRNLQFLYLYRNKLSRVLPSPVQALNLTEIDLSMNNLRGEIPEDFGKLENLTVLNLYSNQLSGQIPKGLALIKKLKTFKIFSNKLNGTLPPEFGLHSKLQGFEVAGNQLTGSLPENLCAGGALLGVIAFSNYLSGALPNWLGNCSTLRSVQLFSNNFTGEVPLGLWTSWNLTTLMISGNSFSGQLPNKLAWNMSRLEISSNKFSGPISVGISSSANLVVFNARNNLLSGEIPKELTGLSRLDSLFLDGNNFFGTLPSEIVSWQSLTSLTLSRNKLSGQIPAAIGDLQSLTYLDLSENDFSGEIPFELDELKLIFLNLSSNKLSGKIPDDFNNLAYEKSFLNNPDLCASNPRLSLPGCFTQISRSKKSSSKYITLVVVLTIMMLIAVASLALYKLKDLWSKRNCRSKLSTWRLTSFQRLDLTELDLFSNLTDSNLIGSGGSGKVYRVALNRPGEYVAVKKIGNCKKLNDNLEKEFMTEVEILGSIRHSNIVKLFCCISSENSKLLVYEYMENQSLDRWIHGKKQRSANELSSPNTCLVLSWPARLKIAIGAAQGLCYMHHHCLPPIIHRDVKSSNILLDSEFRASIADFGLAKMLAKHGEDYSLSAIAGSFGYIPPEYAYSTKINEKVDVYSFGVVLLELVTGKQPNNADEHTSLADWAWQYYSEEKSFADALDEEIKQPCHIEEMTTVFKLGLICTSTLPSARPSMIEILQILRRCSGQEGCGEKKKGTEFDFTPLLGDATYISSYKDGNRAMDENDQSSLYSV